MNITPCLPIHRSSTGTFDPSKVLHVNYFALGLIVFYSIAVSSLGYRKNVLWTVIAFHADGDNCFNGNEEARNN